MKEGGSGRLLSPLNNQDVPDLQGRNLLAID